MENTLQHCIPLIRFFSLSSKEFLHKVSPYKKLLNHVLYKDLLNSYMNPDSEPNDSNISLSRLLIQKLLISNNHWSKSMLSGTY